MGIRLMVSLLLFSSFITLASTIIQLVFDYRRDSGAIRNRLDQIEQTSLHSLADSLWHMDTGQVRLQLEGLLQLPDMRALEVREDGDIANPVIIAAGQKEPERQIAREYRLIHSDREGDHYVGTLYAEASLSGVYDRLEDTAFFILASQGVKTFLVSLFLLVIVNRLVTRHLAMIAGQLIAYDQTNGQKAITIGRPPRQNPDEIDHMVGALNTMAGQIADARKAAENRAEHLGRINEKLLHLARIAAHDLQEPVRPMIAFSGLIRRQIEPMGRPDVLKNLDFIEKGGYRLRTVLMAFQKYVNLLAEPAHPERVPLDRVVRPVLAKRQAELAAVGAEVSVAELPVVRADWQLFECALGELIDNAIRYRSPARGLRLTIQGGRDSSGWFLSLADNGSGLPEDGVEHLFEPFFRFNHASTSTGMGLAVCREVAELHGGRIEACSSAEGTTFTFHIPDGG